MLFKSMYLFASSLLWGLIAVYCSRPSGQITQLNQNTQEQHQIGQYNQPTPTSKDIFFAPIHQYFVIKRAVTTLFCVSVCHMAFTCP